MISLLLAASFLAAPAAADRGLIGAWLKDGAPYLEFRSDGTMLAEGRMLRWKSNGKALTIIYPEGLTEKVPYTLDGDVLSLVVEDKPADLKRAPAKAEEPEAKGKSKKKAGASKETPAPARKPKAGGP